MNKLIFTLYVLYAVTWPIGCVTIKQATVNNSDISIPIWKSNAGGEAQSIDANTSPEITPSL